MLTQLVCFGADVSRVRRLEEASPPVMVLLDPAGHPFCLFPWPDL